MKKRPSRRNHRQERCSRVSKKPLQSGIYWNLLTARSPDCHDRRNTGAEKKNRKETAFTGEEPKLAEQIKFRGASISVIQICSEIALVKGLLLAQRDDYAAKKKRR